MLVILLLLLIATLVYYYGLNRMLAKQNPVQLMDMVAGGQYVLVFEDNEMVKEQRRFALKTLHDVGFGSTGLEDTVHNYALEIVARWRQAGDAEVDVTENIMRAVGNIIWNVTFGATLDFDNPLLIKFRQLQTDINPLLGGPFMSFVEILPCLRKLDFLFGSQIKQLQAVMQESNSYLIESFNPDNQPSCYIKAFLAEMKRREEAGEQAGNFHFTQMLFSAASLWGAGFDTTVNMLRMCCIELVNLPDAQRRIQKEIDEAIGQRRLRYEDLKLLPYTHAFLQELYRVSNSLPLNFMRKTTQDTEIEGHHIAAGTTILPQFSMVHSDPREFERPDYFCPERHLNEEGLFVKDSRITPFSMGKRACLGEKLARMEIFVMFATFVQNCHFTPVGKIPPLIEFTTGFSRAVAEFRVKIQPRN